MNPVIRIVLEINGEVFQREISDGFELLNTLSDVLREAEVIEQNQSLRAVDNTEAYVLDRF